MSRGASFDLQSPEVSTLRNLDSVALRASEDICILSKHYQFIFLQVVCQPHLESTGLGMWEVGAVGVA